MDGTEVVDILAEPSNWNRPYSFVKSDWHLVAWLGIFNMVLPTALYYAMNAISDSTANALRISALRDIMYTHVAVYAPLALLSFLTLFDVLKPLTGQYMEYVGSNLHPAVYLYGLWLLSDVAF